MSIQIKETTSMEEGFCQSCETKRDENNQIINTLVFSVEVKKE